MNKQTKKEQIKELVQALAKDEVQYYKWMESRGINCFLIPTNFLRNNIREINFTIDMYELGIDLWGIGRKGLIYIEGLKPVITSNYL